MSAIKIAVYGFGSMPVVHRHLMDLAKAEGHDIAWCAILTLPHYREIIRERLPAADILDVFQTLPRVPKGGDLAQLAGYVGSLTEDMAAQKRQWRYLTGNWLLDRGIDYYAMYKTFLRERGATHLLTSGIESPDAKIVIAVARELGLGVMAPIDLRTLTGAMFSADAVETPPRYAAASAGSRAEAAALVKRFREDWSPARAAPDDIDPASDDATLLPQFLPPFAQRLAGFARVARERPDLFDPVYIRDSVMSNSRLLQRAIWGTRERINAPKFHVGTAAGLPKKFIFYPLQYTPESSINTPAPYFVDQFRVIDALRFAMPSDHVLVVKEHWSCQQLRPVRFMREMMSRPGVVVAKSRIPARDIVERAGLTVSVTGTAVIEAFLAGRSAMALGPGLAAWMTGGVVPLGDLRHAIAERLDRPASDEVVIEHVATLKSARYPVFWGTPHMPGEPMLRRGNMRRFLAAVVDHIEREAASGAARPLSTQA